MEIDNETMPSPDSEVQRETNIVPVDLVAPFDSIVLVNLVAPIDMPKDITVGHKNPSWAQQTLQEEEGHKSSQGTTRGSKRPKRFLS
jgi:hypothetical protein